MKRGDTIYLKRPTRFIKAELISLYDWPAARVRIRGLVKIVGRDEVLSAEKLYELRRERVKQAAAYRYSWIISHWKPGTTCAEWQAAHGWNIGEWSVIRKLKRLKLIT
jgi:hypothetical protein